MRLNILSDLHLSQGALELPDNDADLVILAGDVARPRQAASWAARLAKPVLYVPGNHEFYDGSIGDTVDELKRFCAGTNIRVLDNEEINVEGVRFLGTTLWTDFMLFGEGAKRVAAMQEAREISAGFALTKPPARYSHPTMRQHCSMSTPNGSQVSWPNRIPGRPS